MPKYSIEDEAALFRAIAEGKRQGKTNKQIGKSLHPPLAPSTIQGWIGVMRRRHLLDEPEYPGQKSPEGKKIMSKVMRKRYKDPEGGKRMREVVRQNIAKGRADLQRRMEEDPAERERQEGIRRDSLVKARETKRRKREQKS